MRHSGIAPVPTASHVQVSPDRDLSNEDLLRLDNIQGDLLIGHSKTHEAHIYFTITDKAALGTFIASLPITSAADTFRPDPGNEIALLTGQPAPTVRFGVGFSFHGLQSLETDLEGALDRAAFEEGMHGRAVAEFNDPDPSDWQFGRPDDKIDGVFIITGKSQLDVQGALEGPFSAREGYRPVGEPVLSNGRAGEFDGFEHFGFRDGISQPGIRGCVDSAKSIPLTQNSVLGEPDKGLPGQDLLWPGEFVLGYHAQKDGAKTFPEKGDIEPVPDWMKDGAFMVIRKLRQFVPEMHAGVAAATPVGQRPEQFEAQLVGRWPGGAPVITHPDADDADLGRDEKRNNDFEFGGDRLGLTCPWAAHIRKTYPRDDVRGKVGPNAGQLPEEFEAEVKEEEARTHRRRLLRRGLQYGPELTDQEIAQGKTFEDRGLMFKCYVTSLTRQFEFVQKLWVNNDGFVQIDSGHDPIIGQTTGGGDRTFAGVGYIGHKPNFTFSPWVLMTGGGYFFAPSMTFLSSLQPKTV